MLVALLVFDLGGVDRSAADRLFSTILHIFVVERSEVGMSDRQRCGWIDEVAVAAAGKSGVQLLVRHRAPNSLSRHS